MDVQLKAWGNSLGIRIPKNMLRQLHLREDDTLSVEVEGGRLTLTPAIRHLTLEERAAAYDGNLMLSESVDWGDPAGNEVW